MDEEEDGDWDHALIKVLDETVYLTSQLPPSSPATVPAPAREIATLPHAVQLQSARQRNKLPLRDPFIRYSPSRVLSQRVSVPNDSEKDLEIDLLKKELERVSKQLLDKEQECSELRKGNNEETQTKNSNAKSKELHDHASKRTNFLFINTHTNLK
ncbi:hypothetical protein AALP_AA6G126300 [Arabis alpina]|uniref:Uncharacterized protein n=1 Tax=Arabis alpina TaxID=50452 RepID=A0A087GNU4_ARAAL|nr:hypothetical protein AALP_AA6G126300 [Arabis alpina]